MAILIGSAATAGSVTSDCINNATVKMARSIVLLPLYRPTGSAPHSCCSCVPRTVSTHANSLLIRKRPDQIVGGRDQEGAAECCLAHGGGVLFWKRESFFAWETI